MSVERIEQYGDTLKVILKPTKNFPEGFNYYYTDIDALNLVENNCWFLVQHSTPYVKSKTWGSSTFFHQELANLYLGYYPKCLEHINDVGFDNTNDNLNECTDSQNMFNKFTRSYEIIKGLKAKIIFRPILQHDYNRYYPYGTVHSEDQACILQNELEQVWLKEHLQDDYYMFDFLKYRRGSEEILDLERTGQISSEEAIYYHVLKYSDNAWYMLRYELEQYYRDNHIAIPKYSLDIDGFMVHPITGQKLCPFEYKGGR